MPKNWHVVPHLPPLRTLTPTPLIPLFEALTAMQVIHGQENPGFDHYHHDLTTPDGKRLQFTTSDLPKVAAEHPDFLNAIADLLEHTHQIPHHQGSLTERYTHIVDTLSEAYPVVMAVEFRDGLDFHLRFKNVDDAVKWTLENHPKGKLHTQTPNGADLTVPSRRHSLPTQRVAVRTLSHQAPYTFSSFKALEDLCKPS